MQAALGVESEEIERDPTKFLEEYQELMRGNRIKVIHNSLMTVQDVESVVNHLDGKVGLIIFDQLWKMGGFEKESSNDVDRQTKLFGWARSMADVAPVLNVHQADASAEGMLHFEMNQLYGSKTGIQGECDAIVTLGRPHSAEYSANTRGLYAPKNKLAGGPRRDKTMKNAKFEVEIQPDIARFTGAL